MGKLLTAALGVAADLSRFVYPLRLARQKLPPSLTSGSHSSHQSIVHLEFKTVYLRPGPRGCFIGDGQGKTSSQETFQQLSGYCSLSNGISSFTGKINDKTEASTLAGILYPIETVAAHFVNLMLPLETASYNRLKSTFISS